MMIETFNALSPANSKRAFARLAIAWQSALTRSGMFQSRSIRFARLRFTRCSMPTSILGGCRIATAAAVSPANPQLFGDYEQLEDREPVSLYVKPQIETYLAFCRDKAVATMAAETEEISADRPGSRGGIAAPNCTCTVSATSSTMPLS